MLSFLFVWWLIILGLKCNYSIIVSMIFFFFFPNHFWVESIRDYRMKDRMKDYSWRYNISEIKFSILQNATIRLPFSFHLLYLVSIWYFINSRDNIKDYYIFAYLWVWLHGEFFCLPLGQVYNQTVLINSIDNPYWFVVDYQH